MTEVKNCSAKPDEAQVFNESTPPAVDALAAYFNEKAEIALNGIPRKEPSIVEKIVETAESIYKKSLLIKDVLEKPPAGLTLPYGQAR